LGHTLILQLQWSTAAFQEVVVLRERGWGGLPPLPVFTTGKPRSAGTDQKDPAATPATASLRLPNGDIESQIAQPPPLESVTAPEADEIRVHTSILSLRSPALRRKFAQASLATAESPSGCPRIFSSDLATDFATLLKMIYLPGQAVLPTGR
jgi:hypothetical protein